MKRELAVFKVASRNSSIVFFSSVWVQEGNFCLFTPLQLSTWDPNINVLWKCLWFLYCPLTFRPLEEKLESSQSRPSHTNDVDGDMVDDTKLKPTRIEIGGKRKRGSKMVVITQQQKSEYSSQLEVEPTPALPPRLDTNTRTPSPSRLDVANARAPPGTINHLQQDAQRGSIGNKVGASLTTCSRQISIMWKKTSIATILDIGFTSHPIMVDMLNFLKKGA